MKFQNQNPKFQTSVYTFPKFLSQKAFSQLWIAKKIAIIYSQILAFNNVKFG
jgi:hypothetical protein